MARASCATSPRCRPMTASLARSVRPRVALSTIWPPWACATGRSCPQSNGLLPLPLRRSFGFAGNIDLLPESHEELAADFVTWKARGGEDADPLYTAFKHRNADWLEKYCVYMAVKKHFEGLSRHDWPADVARYNEHLIDDERFHDEAELQAYMQYRFDLAWCELMNYAHKKGIEVIGDIPMYVSDDSADAWSEPENFWLSDTGKAIEISGAPPDNFAPEGQVWGNPTFRWDHMKGNGYSWWMDRLRRAFALYDRVRLDHFLGFHSYF